MSLQNWKIIQRHIGLSPADGIPGPKTAKALKKFMDIKVYPSGDEFFDGGIVAPMVKGNAKGITDIVLHCTATREGQDFDAAIIKKWHLKRGWSDIGYHFVIQLDGTTEIGRPEHIPGAHVAGFNTGSIGVVYVGGLDVQGRPKDTRTPAQLRAMTNLVTALTGAYPKAKVKGHRDFSPDLDGDGVIEQHEWIKQCPCFDAASWWEGEG
jgi:N-acetylmuramoyl-L-alanine amidase